MQNLIRCSVGILLLGSISTPGFATPSYCVIPSGANQSEAMVCAVEESSCSPTRFLDSAIIPSGNYCSARNDNLLQHPSTDGQDSSSLNFLRHDLDSLFHTPEFSNATFGMAIQSLKTGEYLYRLNDTKSLVPASNMKLFTAAETLALLRPAFRYKTEVLTNGTIKNHALYGDVIIRGTGDPTFLSLFPDTLSNWIWNSPLTSHATRKIDRIFGSLKIDNTYFSPEYYPTGWQLDDIPYYYATPISALVCRENQIALNIFPGASIGAPPRVSYNAYGESQPPYGVLRNLAVTGAKSSELTIDAARKNCTDTVVITGSIPIGSTQIDQQTSIDDPTKYATVLIHNDFEDNGAFFQNRRNKNFRDTSQILEIEVSPPLFEIVDTMNKTSNNVYAECLFRTVAKVVGGEGSWTRGIEVMRKYLASIGIDTTQLQFTDGSGLSRMDLVTADAIVKLLHVMSSDPKLDSAFYNSLPIMGVDGTLENRLKNTPAMGNIHAKTGSMTGVRSISGYLTTHDGEPIAFSILANNYTCPGSEIGKLEDEVLLNLVNFSRTR